MPYKIVKRKDRYVVINKDTGEVKAGNKTKLSKARAEKVKGALYHAEAGRKFTKTKK